MNNSERLQLDIRPDAFADINSKEELLACYRQFKAIEASIKENLDFLKEKGLDIAPDLIVTKPLRRWTYKPGIHKLPQQYFQLRVKELSSVYDSAEGGEKYLKKYGFSFKESTSHSWKPGLTKEDKEAS